jgi:hypothetical protein
MAGRELRLGTDSMYMGSFLYEPDYASGGYVGYIAIYMETFTGFFARKTL